ncbi:hypothetical protein C8P66_11412 [Humitalea rosea]|uniref:DUF1178 family protein n=1 Tax=Humitalea rosea TaxID=990373 RepID=A0A2W7J180_9PROT|nr:DUF1178 family protein [Humitalea rosea]PZW44723.1 hypothetical protein C8P66_11412 [Humitalea rosea]
MIHYQLCCDHGHSFDGWFRDSAGFERQAAAKLVDCPECGSHAVTRALMAPALGKPRATPVAPAAPVAAVAPPPGPMPAKLVALLQRVRAEVEANCDYVGPAFAEEARRRARAAEPEPPRGIYGEATEAEAEALRDEGIEIGQVPWVPRADG